MERIQLLADCEAEQLDRDTVIQFPDLQQMVPAHDWVISVNGKPLARIRNRVFRELFIGASDEDDEAIRRSVPSYAPGEPAHNPDIPEPPAGG